MDRALRTRAAISPLLLVLAAPAAAQDRLYELPWTGVGPSFSITEPSGYEDALAAIGDLDGDGVTELARGSAAEGVVRIFSGATGALLRTIDDSPSAKFGQRVQAAGDVDGDGVPDLYVGVTRELTGEIRSGATGALIHRFELPGTSFNELEFAPLQDVDGDGRDEFAIGASYEARIFAGGVLKVYTSPEAPLLRVHDGATGAVLSEIAGAPGQTIGEELVALSDLDGDGVRDLATASDQGFGYQIFTAVGSLSGQILWQIAVPIYDACRVDDVDGDGLDDVVFGAYGLLILVSGATGEQLWQRSSPGGLGASAVAVDWNGDGVGDLVAGAIDNPYTYFGTIGCTTCTGRVEVLDGGTGTTLTTYYGEPGDVNFGAGVAPLGDANGDGVPDLAVAHSGFAPGATGTRAVSGAPLSLSADGHLLSLSAGGSYGLQLAFGPARAGQAAWVVATASGTSPGVDLGAVHLPIVPDGFTTFVLESTPPLLLDGAGAAAIVFPVAPGLDPGLAGLTLHYAAVAFDAAGTASAASAALPLTLVE